MISNFTAFLVGPAVTFPMLVGAASADMPGDGATGAGLSQSWSASPALVESLCARRPGVRYRESDVPDYSLPDSLMMSDGTPVTDADTFLSKRRPEILELFRANVYGRSPGRPRDMTFKLFEFDPEALNGTAVRKQLRVSFSGGSHGPGMDLLIHLPKSAERPVPIFAGLNFGGNHSIHSSPAIRLASGWIADRRAGVVENRATEKARGTASSRWPIEKIISRGYGVATVYCGDLDPDFHDDFKNGVHGFLDRFGSGGRPADAWGTIAAWAWGLSRAMDYFEHDDDIDHDRVAVMGHSRLGKTALWAGARDERFALVISNCSGCGGAALSRRAFGETVERINSRFPHWFCERFRDFNDREDLLPVDQHMLIALIAPRPVYVASADRDLWADPRGEFLAAKAADPVYRLLGVEGMDAEKMPGLNGKIESIIGYHIRPGKHDITLENWNAFMNFADRHLR